MNGFQSFVDHLLKITETYELNELYLGGSIIKMGTLVRHLLRAFQHLDKSGEPYAKNALREINNTFIPQLNGELLEIPWKKEIVKKRILGEWEPDLLGASKDYEHLYKNDLLLYPLTSKCALTLISKIDAGRATFEDLGLIEDFSNQKRLQFSFNFEEAIKRNS